jgi:predicted transcriptional regulator
MLKVVSQMKRSLFEIIAEILQVAKNGAKKTNIMYSCNLSYRMTEKFLNYLLEAGFIRIGNSFHTTEKGMQFLQAYQTLELLLNTKI